MRMNALRKFAETSPDAACIRLHSQNRIEMQKMRKSCAGNALVMRVECAEMHTQKRWLFFAEKMGYPQDTHMPEVATMAV